MEADRTILTDNSKIADAIRRSVPDKVMEVDAHFIELSHPGFNSEFEPQFRVTNPEMTRAIQGLVGQVVCALPPALPGSYRPSKSTSDNFVLYSVAMTLRNRPAAVLYAPLPSLQLEAIQAAIAQAAKLDPWHITSMAARRITERIISLRLAGLEQEQLEPMGWMSYYYLYLIDSLSREWWTRHVRFDTCIADEIDAFGGAIRHPQRPRVLQGRFDVVEKKPIHHEFKDPRFRLNRLLQDSGVPLYKAFALLNCAYEDGHCAWPFRYGGVDYGEPRLEATGCADRDRPQSPELADLLQKLPGWEPAERIVRRYKQDRYLFRSVSYYSEGGKSLYNPIPESAPVKMARERHDPDNTVDGLLDCLTEQELNIDLEAFLRLLSHNYIDQQGRQLALSEKGKRFLQRLGDAKLSRRVFYLILRALENIHLDESSYNDVMGQIIATLNCGQEESKEKAARSN
jgi:hypothetical protein